ncbi:MAG TPA: energy transducer TonB [Terriglobia bacterium]|nr:energy transducer TonB [Terriglobia bacterium]
MPMLSLDLEPPAASPRPERTLSGQGAEPLAAHCPKEFQLTSVEIRQGAFPSRSFLYSLFLHGSIVLAIVFAPVSRVPIYDPPQKWELTMIPKDALYLPQLGGGSAGGGSKKGEAQPTPAARKASVAARSEMGVSYPGVQAIVSDPPDPTNRIETILQPTLPHPPVLKMFIPLPSIVRLAQALPAPPPPLPAASPKPQPRASQQPNTPPVKTATELPLPMAPQATPAPIEAPKLTLPVQDSAGTNTPLQAMARPPVPPAEAKAAAPRLQTLPGAGGLDNRSLLVVSPMAAPNDQARKVPEGEARGQFAIAALPNLAMSHLGPGSAAETPGAGAVGLATHPDAAAHDAAGATTASAGPGAHTDAAAGGSGAADAALGSRKGESGSVTGASSGAGVVPGSGAGRGKGFTSGSGTGAGAGPGTGAFPGITIQGGEWAGDTASSSGSRALASANRANDENGSYGLTIVSTGRSGGGLADFGVFRDEASFTVYIDPPVPADDPAPSWTLEYAALDPTAQGGPRGELAAPFPLKKAGPNWPADLVTRYRGQNMVVYGLIDQDGKLQQMKVMQTPDADLDGALLAALGKWSFRPAKVNTKPVAVKVLLGVPVSSY